MNQSSVVVHPGQILRNDIDLSTINTKLPWADIGFMIVMGIVFAYCYRKWH